MCDGKGKLIGMFPVYAPHVPKEKRKPYVELECSFCEGAGVVDDAALQRREQGQACRQERLSRGMGLRAEAERLGISPVELSQREQGIAAQASSGVGDVAENK
jgi:hypothetical protein